MVRFLFQFILVFFIAGALFAQEKFPDSVKTDREKAKYYAEFASSNISQDSAIYYSNKAIKYAENCNDCTELLYKVRFNKIVFLYNMGKSSQALSELKILDSLLLLKNDDYFRFKSAFQHSLIYTFNIDKPQKALDYGKKALQITSNIKDSTLMAESYYLLYNIYTNFKQDSVARNYLTKAYIICTDINENNNLYLRVLFALIDKSKNLSEFNIYTDKCLELIKQNKTSLKTYEAYFYVLKGTALRANFKKYKEAKDNLLIGLHKCKDISYDVMYNYALLDLGLVENKLGNYQNAIAYFNEYKKAKDFSLENKLSAIEGLSFAYAKLNNYKKANDYKDVLLQLKDTILKNNATKDFAKFNVKLATAEKDKEIAQQKLQLEQEKSKRNKLIFGSLGLLLLGFMGFQWNNNRQKRKKLLAETQLQKEQEVNELRTKFLGNIAHEIRTPLTLISGNLNLALENFDQKEKAKQNIKTALINSKKVVEDANEILELLKFEKNKTTIKLNTVPLDQTLKRIFKSFVSLAEMKQIKLVYQSNIEADVTAKIDVEKVEKILNNLVSNAVKYSPSDAKIIFDAQLNKNQQLTVKVTDFGQGIHFNETEKIFERFYQSSQSNAVGGIGIGLSLAKEFAELLNGNLNVESELGNGSTFIFRMPVEIAEENNIQENQEINRPISENITTQIHKESVEETSTEAINNNKKPKILIVEDNPEMASYLEEILSSTYDCEKAFDGQQALYKINTNSYDLITSDIMMPRLDGFQLREKLNEDAKFKNIPFILISAKTLEEDKIKGFNLGIDDYVVKPFNKNELLARINNLLQNKLDRESWIQQHPEEVEEIDAAQKQLLDKIKAVVEENISDEEFKVTQLASVVGYSQRQLTRILKQHTGMSPVKFILEIRLQKAYRLLQNKVHFTLSEVRYDVGIPSSSYFNRKFKERFGISPNELLT